MSKSTKEEGETVSLPDGRDLGYLIAGEGKPVFYFHGLPGSRLDVLFQKGIGSKHLQMIGVDRPGFGLSTFAPNRRASDFAADISHLANHLEIEEFALLGFSGGAHYAITCAALLAEHVTRALVISGLSLPVDTSEMSRTNKLLLQLGTMPIVGTWLQKKQRDMILKIAKDPDAFMESEQGKNMLENVPKEEAKLLLDPELRNVYFRTSVEAYRQGSDSIKAMIQEAKLMKKGWEVDLSKIPSGLVQIWHGTADKSAPVNNAYKNAKAIPGAHLETFEGGGHAVLFDNLGKLGEILGS
jgi:pimeloyl-ACP methyl ester carboxylesterase